MGFLKSSSATFKSSSRNISDSAKQHPPAVLPPLSPFSKCLFTSQAQAQPLLLCHGWLTFPLWWHLCPQPLDRKFPQFSLCPGAEPHVKCHGWAAAAVNQLLQSGSKQRSGAVLPLSISHSLPAHAAFEVRCSCLKLDLIAAEKHTPSRSLSSFSVSSGTWL